MEPLGIERRTFFSKTSNLTLTFDNVTWYLLSTGIHFTKFGNFQAKGSKDIDWASLSLQTHRPTDRCKTICPLFSNGGITRVYLFFFFSLLVIRFLSTPSENDLQVKIKFKKKNATTAGELYIEHTNILSENVIVPSSPTM